MPDPRPASPLRTLLRPEAAESRLFHAAALCSALVACAIILQAHALSTVLSDGILTQAPPAAVWFMVLAVAAAGRLLAGYGRDRLSHIASQRMRQRLRLTLLDRLTTRPSLSGEGAGALVTGLSEQVDAVDGYLSRYKPQMTNAVLTPLLLAAAALPVEPLAAGILLVTAPLVPLFLALIGIRTKRAQDRQMANLTRMGGYFLDRLRGLGTLRLLGRAEDESGHIGAVADEFRRSTMAVLKLAFLSSAALEFFASLGVAMVAATIGLKLLGQLGQAADDGLRTGLFLLILAPEFYLPLRQMAAAYHDRSAAQSACEALQRQFPQEAEAEEIDARGELPSPPFAVTLSDLHVHYPGSSHPVLAGANARFEPGERIALLGPSGSGKSTLLALLFALMQPDRGTIRIGDTALADVAAEEWRQRIAWQGQSPHLFQGTIRANLALACPDADDATLANMASRVGLDDLLASLPRGWHTEIGERGHGLSGGQARRLALGRCLLKPAGLVLLDEPTAHLDRDTEAALLDTLLAQPRDRIYIFATHSEAVAKRMDRVLVIRQGQLVTP